MPKTMLSHANKMLSVIRYFFKGSDWLAMVVKLRVEYWGDIFQDLFETFKMFLRFITV